MSTKVNAITEANIDSLTRKRVQLVRCDAYGKPQVDKWEKEIDYFITNHVRPALTAREQQIMEGRRREIARFIGRHTFERTRTKTPYCSFREDMTPAEFEIFCAEQLKISGWKAQVTLRSRDQGVDVIAEKSGVRVVLQCKFYSGSVGNGAVQEIAAGKAHEQAHYGAVVTNSRYTAPAEQLASTNGILLLHYRDLANLDRLIPQSCSQ